MTRRSLSSALGRARQRQPSGCSRPTPWVGSPTCREPGTCNEHREGEFRAALGHFASGVVVVTGIHDGHPTGFTCQSFFSLSLDPPLVALAPGKASTSWPKVAEGGNFCANVLAADQESLARTFANSGGDKFSGVGWLPSPSGPPRLHGALVWIDCAIETVYEAGDHYLVGWPESWGWRSPRASRCSSTGPGLAGSSHSRPIGTRRPGRQGRMNIGVVFPQTEIGGDVDAVRAYALGVERLGYSHVLAYDHVVGADTAVHLGWSGPYDLDTTFHEPLVLFGFLAGITSLELVTGVIILPQRQTVLVAKQAAEVDLLSKGRFRLGIGLGWNAVEYEALGRSFSDRGRRSEEQVALLRRLWSEKSVTHEGASERVTGAGLAPMPIQRPIPVWFGARSAPALRRAGRLADGWFPLVAPGPELDAAREIVDGAARAAGRDPASLGMEGRVTWSDAGAQSSVSQIERWREVGATHLSINTMGAGFETLDDHLAALGAVAVAAGLPAG